MVEYNFAPQSAHQTIRETAMDMLLNSEATLRAPVGIGSQEAFDHLQRFGFVGEGGTLTQKGVRKARLLQQEAGWL